METNQALFPPKSNGGGLAHGSNRALMDALAAVRWDLRNAIREGAVCPEELNNNIGRVFDEIDASIRKLDAMERDPR